MPAHRAGQSPFVVGGTLLRGRSSRRVPAGRPPAASQQARRRAYKEARPGRAGVQVDGREDSSGCQVAVEIASCSVEESNSSLAGTSLSRAFVHKWATIDRKCRGTRGRA